MDERGMDQAVDVYFTNDPYYPRPPPRLRKPQGGALPDVDNLIELLQLYEDGGTWATFQTGYLATSLELLKDSVGHRHLPQVFIGKVKEEQMKRFAATSTTSGELGAGKSEPLLQEEEWVVVPSEDLSHEPATVMT